MQEDRTTLGHVIRSITGHNFYNRHNHIVNPAEFPDPSCRKCSYIEETPYHIITECPALKTIRFKFFGCYILDLDLTLPSWSPSKLGRFLKEPLIAQLEGANEAE